MHAAIHFRSSLFDVSREPENPINPIKGSSLLDWLRECVPTNLAMTDKDAEDWGWYCDVTWEGRDYLVGSCAQERDDGNHEWILQIDKLRSFKEKLFGFSKMTADDACFLFFKRLIENEQSFTEVTIKIRR